MFADDTTIFTSGYNSSKTITEFSKLLLPFLDWVLNNQLTINWNKTKLMIITKQRIVRPKSLVINSITVEVVDVFKLLGVTIDHNLFFYKYFDCLRSSVNCKFYSSKKLFFLSNNIKVQFFKNIYPVTFWLLHLIGGIIQQNVT